MTYEAWRISYQSSEQAARAAYAECVRLRAKIEQMEKQEPVARIIGNVTEWVSNGDGTYSLGGCVDAFAPLPDETKLYLATGAQPAPTIAEQDQINAEAAIRSIYGAQPAPSVPVDLITDYLVSISAHVAHQDDPKAQAEIGELLRMLAAAQEVKSCI